MQTPQDTELELIVTVPALGRTFVAPMVTILAFCSTLVLAVHSQANTGITTSAPDVSFYLGLGEDCCGEDPHPVHGIATSDGGYAIVGKVIDTGGNWDGFLVKIMGEGRSGTSFLEMESFSDAEWSLTVGTPGQQDGINNVASTDSALFAAGFLQAGDGTVDRYLCKFDQANGALIWDATFPDPITGRDGAFESIMPTSDGGLITTGLINAQRGALEGFKSYGNAWDGEGFIAYFSPSQLASPVAPDAPTWITLLPNTVSGKGIREIQDTSGGYVVAAGPREDEPARAIRISAAGDILWNIAYPSHGEVTDIAVLGIDDTITGFTMVGHRDGDAGGIDGSVTMLSTDGEVLWQKSIGNPSGGVGAFSGLGSGNPQLIFDECWGITGTPDGGAVVACGTGIEGCDAWSPGSATRTECDADPRRTWRGLIVKLDASGNEVWHRVDSFAEPGEEGDDVSDSASEYVSLTSEGAVISIVDQGFGIGLLVLEPENQSSTSDSSQDQSNNDTTADASSDDSETNTPSTPDDSDIDRSEENTSEDLQEGSGCATTPNASPGFGTWILLTFLASLLCRRHARHA